ncbi:hypothetical protein EEK90_04170 [Muribaculaceae bacterium Isolate-036 (Harlan)]|nr:hypothetical protein EEK90_04170 [Muribaculaceae bacterium Isolate-036 (Harlan)]
MLHGATKIVIKFDTCKRASKKRFMKMQLSNYRVAFVLALHIYSKMFENTRFLLTFGEKCLYLRVYKIEPI